jgi:hypothetical protein
MAESMMQRGEMPHIGAVCSLQQQYLEPCLGPRHRKGKAIAEGRALAIVDIWAVRICTFQPALGGHRCFEYECRLGQALARAVFGPGFGGYAPGVSGTCTARCLKVSSNEGN